jgi:pancreatic triacylglycerol lipase
VLLASPLINPVQDKASLVRLKEGAKWEKIPDINGNFYLVDMNSYNFSAMPAFTAEKEVKFVLSTRYSSGQELKLDEASIRNSSFNKNHPTRFTIHGWNGDHTSGVNSIVTEEYLKLGDFNCIMVDWSRGSGKTWWEV